jgi:hypothetical protein
MRCIRCRKRSRRNPIRRRDPQSPRRRSRRHAYLESLNFQASDSYEKLGYRILARLKGFPENRTR